jgi:hypothetical protein
MAALLNAPSSRPNRSTVAATNAGDVVGARDVAGRVGDLVPGGHELVGERRERFLGPGDEHERRPVLGEHPGRVGADACTGADDEDGLAGERQP